MTMTNIASISRYRFALAAILYHDIYLLRTPFQEVYAMMMISPTVRLTLAMRFIYCRRYA